MRPGRFDEGDPKERQARQLLVEGEQPPQAPIQAVVPQKITPQRPVIPPRERRVV